MSDTQIRIKQDTLSKLKRFEASVKIDGKHPKHSGAIELAVDIVNDTIKLLDECDGDDVDCAKLLADLFDLFDKFER